MQQTEGNPRLATKFGCEPTGDIGDEWEWYRQEQNPVHPARDEEPAPPKHETGQGHDGNENGTQPNHDVVAVIEHFNIIGALIGGKIIKPPDPCCPAAVGENTEYVGEDNRIVESTSSRIRLPNNDNTSAAFCLEKALHRGKFRRLVCCNLGTFH